MWEAAPAGDLLSGPPLLKAIDIIRIPILTGEKLDTKLATLRRQLAVRKHSMPPGSPRGRLTPSRGVREGVSRRWARKTPAASRGHRG